MDVGAPFDDYKPMIFQNKIFLNKGTLSDIIIFNVNSYLSPKFIRTVSLFQILTQTHAHFQGYDLSKLPMLDRKSIFQLRPILLLVGGINKNIKIKMQMIRIINIGGTVVCLVRDKFQQSQNRFFPLIIIFPDQKKAQKWCSRNLYLSVIVLHDPYLNFKSYYQNMLIIGRFDSIVIQNSYELHEANWHDAKMLANLKFKEKKYKQALILYQSALGLLWDSSKRRDRAILYSNTSQSFLDLNLNENSLQYANAAIIIDKTFIKSYHRKLCSLLQLKQFTKIPPILAVMNRFCSKEEFTTAHERYTRYLANQTGLFNWYDIFVRRVNAFGQYLSNKVKFKSPTLKYQAAAPISRYELIAVQKNALFITEINNEDNGLMPKFLGKLKDLVDLDANFFEKIITSPLIKEIINKKTEDYMDAVIVEANNHIHCFQSIFKDQISIQICPDYIFFKDNGQHPNCTILSLNGAFFYFALRDIEADQPLSADLFNKAYQQPQKSLLIMNEESQINGLQIYLQRKEELLKKKMFKTAVIYLWRAVKEGTNENRAKLTRQLSHIIELFPLWEVAVLILCQLRKSKHFAQRRICQSSILLLFERCFKITKIQASQIVGKLISQ